MPCGSARLRRPRPRSILGRPSRRRCPGSSSRWQATLADRPFRDEDWLFEVKWDGYRLQAHVRDGKVRTFTRNGNDGATYFPRLLDPATWIAAGEAIVDGEVVALDKDGLPDFSLLQERIGVKGTDGRAAPEFVFQAFDLLYLDGRSLLQVPLEDRKRLLRSVIRENARVRFASHVETEGVAFLEACAAQGLEGIIAKHRRSRYESGQRSRAWLKLKIRPEQELVVGGWTPGEGSAKDLGALVVGTYERDEAGDEPSGKGPGKSALKSPASRTSTSPARSGPGSARRREGTSWHGCRTSRSSAPPFDPPPPKDYKGRWGGDLARVNWVRPELVIRAELGGWTRDGIVRQGSYKGIELGRDPLEVTRESAMETKAAVKAAEAEIPGDAGTTAAAPEGRGKRGKGAVASPAAGTSAAPAAPAPAPSSHIHPWEATPGELAALDALGKEGVWSVGGVDLKLTNLDKPMFPARDGDPGGPITKRELVRYFALIAPAMLPHLAERPLNLHRFPNGADKPGFWQKDLRPTDPKWLRRWREVGVEARQANDHVVADRVGTLCWLGNQAAFEVHAWTSRLDAPFRPTFALIDIDPGTNTTWDETLVLTRLFRTALGHLGVRGYPKVTGQRGIQIWIPIVPRYDHGQTVGLGREAVTRGRRDRPGSRVVGVVQGQSRRQGPPRLHPERLDQDARRAVCRAARARRAGLGADHLGRAGRSRSPPRPLDHPHAPGPRGGGRRPVRGRAD